MSRLTRFARFGAPEVACGVTRLGVWGAWWRKRLSGRSDQRSGWRGSESLGHNCWRDISGRPHFRTSPLPHPESRRRSGKDLLADGAGSEVDTGIFDGQPGDFDLGEIGRAEACRFGQQQRVVAADDGGLAAPGARVIAHHGGADGVDAYLIAACQENAGLHHLDALVPFAFAAAD